MNTVLGYGKQGEYSGPSWELNAISNALARGLITGDADLSSPASRQEVFQYIFNTLRPDPDGLAKNFMVEYSNIVNAYLPSGTNAFQGALNVHIDAYLGSRVFGLAQKVTLDDFGVNWHTWTKSGRNLVGDNKYLHDTLIDEFVTEKIWTGGDLALAYEWDNQVITYTNGEWNTIVDVGITTTATNVNPIKRGDVTRILPEIGYKVQLFDSGEVYRNSDGERAYGADNGSVGKVVIVREDLAQVTRVNATNKTVDFKFFDGTAQNLTVAAYPTDETFAVNDYIAVVVANENLEDGDEDTHPDVTPGSILRAVKTESIEVRPSSYSRNTDLTGGVVRLATITGNTSDRYIFDSWYKFGLNTVPNFDGDALLILDSNGRVLGFSGDVAGPAAYKYVYVSGIYKTEAIPGFTAPRVQARAHNVAAGTSRTVDLPVTKTTGGVYQVTINNTKIDLTGKHSTTDTNSPYYNTQVVAEGEIAVDEVTNLVTLKGTKRYGSENLLGWWYYTSADDADTITLRNPQVPSGVAYTQHSIQNGATSTGSLNTYGVGSVTVGSFARSYDAGLTGLGFTPYADSKTIFYYNGVKYTGYSAFPVAIGGATTKALVVQGSDKVIDVVHVYGDVDITPKATSFAIIADVPTYEYLSDGKITYRTVLGTTAAITNAAPNGGVYEVVDPGAQGNYRHGDIVTLKQVGTEWEILDKVAYGAASSVTANTPAVVATGTVLDHLGSYFTVSGGIPTVTLSANYPVYDLYAERNNLNPKQEVEEGDEIQVLVDYSAAMFVNVSYAVVIVSYAGAPAIDYAITSTITALNADAIDADAGIYSITAEKAGLSEAIFKENNGDTTWQAGAEAKIKAALNAISGQSFNLTLTNPGIAAGTADVTATVDYKNAAGTVLRTLTLKIQGVEFTSDPPPAWVADIEGLGASAIGVPWSDVAALEGHHDSSLNALTIPSTANVYILFGASGAIEAPAELSDLDKVDAIAGLASGKWCVVNVNGYNYLILIP